jgi:hypothetical protein
MAIHSLHNTEPATQHTILIAAIDTEQRTFLAGQLDADGHTVYDADHAARLEAQRILTDLLEEIHELPHALAAAIASQDAE